MGLIMMSIYIISGALFLLFDPFPGLKGHTKYILGAILMAYGIFRGFRLVVKRKQSE